MSKDFPYRIPNIAVVLLLANLAILHLQSVAQSSTQPSSPSLQEQLEAQYPPARISTSGGCTVSNADTAGTLVIQKPGVVAVRASSFAPKCASHYKEGRLSPPGAMCTGIAKKWNGLVQAVPWGRDKTSNLDKIPEREVVQLEKGESVYATRLEVTESKGEVKVSIGYCSGEGSQAVPYKGEVIFNFKSDVFKNVNVTQVEDAIGEVFGQDSANDRPTGDSNPSQPESEPQPGQVEGTMPATSEPSTGSSTGVPDPRTIALQERAIEIVSFLGENRFETVYANYTDAMKKVGSPERMSGFWNNQIQRFGPFVKILNAEKNADSDVVNVVCAFRDGQVNVEVIVLHPSLKINGLWIQPAPGRHWPPR